MPERDRPHLAAPLAGAHASSKARTPAKGAVNPLLQRFLIAWAAGVATTGVIAGTAKRPHRLKRRRRKKKKGQAAEPVQIGAVALSDARAPADPGMSVEEWAAGVKALPSRVAGIFARVPKQADGAREPDEIRTADGATVKGAAGRKTRRRGRRKQATLWDSAKESMRQTVRDVVKDEVKDTPVGNAVEAAKKAGDRVKEGAGAVKEGAAVVAEGAVKVGAQVGVKAKSLLNRILEAVEANPAPNADPEAEALAEEEERQAPSARADMAPDRSPEIGGAPHEPRGAGLGGGASAPSLDTAEGASADGAAPAAAAHVAVSPEGAPTTPPIDVAEVGKKLKGGLNAVADWLQGPGAPGYASKRARPANGGGDVVEARDAAAPDAVGAAPSVPVAERVDEHGGDDQQAHEHDAGEQRRDKAGE